MLTHDRRKRIMANNTVEKPDMNKIPQQVSGMFDRVAKRYDLVNDVMTFGQHRFWRQILENAVAAQSGEIVLDIAAGTGTSSIGFARAGAKVVACDFSQGMIEQGRKRHPDLEFVVADAHNLPFGNAEFDVVTSSFGFRNMHNPDRALREFLRVTKPGGRLFIMEFSTPPSPLMARLYEIYMKVILPLAGKILTSDQGAYDYLVESILNWPNQQTLAKQISNNGWKNVGWHNLNFGTVTIHRAFKAG